VRQLRKVLSIEVNPPILEVIQANVVPRLVDLLLHPDATVCIMLSLRSHGAVVHAVMILVYTGLVLFRRHE
jgi:Armadillo/beta-catenin-like repeat-containing protein